MQCSPSAIPLKALVTWIYIMVPVLCNAQDFTLGLQNDLGRSQLAEGVYARPAVGALVRMDEIFASTGFQWTFSQADRKVFSGWQAAAGREFTLRNFPFSVSLFSVINPYSERVREVNIGVLLGHQRDHLLVQFGNASRIYGLTRQGHAAGGSDPDPNVNIIEYRNFTYQFVAWLNKMEHDWNIGAGVSNIDDFRVQQETNPMFLITAWNTLLPGFNISADLWLQGAGLTNLSAETYGFFGRIGLTWTPGKNK